MTNRRLQAATGLSDREYQREIKKLEALNAADAERNSEETSDE